MVLEFDIRVVGGIDLPGSFLVSFIYEDILENQNRIALPVWWFGSFESVLYFTEHSKQWKNKQSLQDNPLKHIIPQNHIF